MAAVVCLRCGAKSPTDDALARVDAGDADPACHDCGGILQPSIVMFGQLLDQAVLAHAAAIAQASQLFLAIGSSLMVEPAAGLCKVAVESGARLVIVNRDPTPYDDLAAEIIREPIGDAVPRLCAMLTSAGLGGRRALMGARHAHVPLLVITHAMTRGHLCRWAIHSSIYAYSSLALTSSAIVHLDACRQEW